MDTSLVQIFDCRLFISKIKLSFWTMHFLFGEMGAHFKGGVYSMVVSIQEGFLIM